MFNKALWKSEKEDWATPQDVFDQLDAEFSFTLDAAASDENHKCENYFTIADDGLAQSWQGENVFCNPPYGRKIGAWVEKCHQESKRATVVALLPARTDTRWFHEHILDVAEIRFIRGRLKFGGATNSAPFPSMIVVWREYDNRKQETR